MRCSAFCINLKKKKVITHQIRDFNHYCFCVIFTLTFFGGSFMAHSLIPDTSRQII